MPPYRYASSENTTDRLEIYMDPYKLRRERAAIELLVQFDWKSALDFGCGSGRYFDVFGEAQVLPSVSRTLVGVDADKSRLATAERRFSSETPNWDLDIRLTVGDESFFERQADDFDLVLCSHVLEHVTEASFTHILSGLASSVKKGGRVILLFQGFWDGFRNEALSCGQDEYLHLIDTSRTPNTDGYRVDVSSVDFDRAIRESPPEMLPVRALRMGEVSPDDVLGPPVAVKGCPPRLEPYFGDLQRFGFMYATHLTEKDGNAIAIGDFVLCFDKPAG